jgi:NAD(P)H-dependent FMN reductase
MEMTQSKPTLKIVLASTRPGRAGEPVARWVEGICHDHEGFEVEFVDLAEVGLPFVDEPTHPIMRQYTQEHTKAWSAVIEPADAFVFVTPEYNYGFSAALKNALDFLFYEWRYKPVGIVSYGGVSAGTRGAQMLKLVMDGLRLSPIGPNVYIPFIHELVVDGLLTTNAEMEKGAVDMLTELVRMEEALRPLRLETRADAPPIK